jgi:hypothetical protein
MKRVAISQSNYIPWRGYFDLIDSVDEFVIYDDAQYTKRDWRNRNLINTPSGPIWLTVPVQVKGRFTQKIQEVETVGTDWAETHWKALARNYREAKGFESISEVLRPIYLGQIPTMLHEINLRFLTLILKYLEVDTVITKSSEFNQFSSDKSHKLLEMCVQAGADVYVSGPSAREYLDLDIFNEMGIDVEWYSYEGYGSYPQQFPGFVQNLSIVDLLFNCPNNFGEFMKLGSK